MADPLQTVSRRLTLSEFVPFRLNRLADAVSVNLSQVYRAHFGLEIPEWRVLVTIGQYGECTAQYIASSTRMHKTRVSRAVAALEERNLIERSVNSHDGREWTLHLTRAGMRVYDALIPLALERERALLACLSDTQRLVLLDALSRLEDSLHLTGDG